MFCLILFDTFDCHKLPPTIDDSLLIPEVIKCPACTVVIFWTAEKTLGLKRNRQNRNRKQWETMSQCPLLKSNSEPLDPFLVLNLTFSVFFRFTIPRFIRSSPLETTMELDPTANERRRQRSIMVSYRSCRGMLGKVITAFATLGACCVCSSE